MKKFLSLFLAAAMAALCGCDKADDIPESCGGVSGSSAPVPGEGTSSAVQSRPINGDNLQNVQPGDKQLTLLFLGGQNLPGKTGCGTDNGFYSIKSNVAGGDLNCITYIDYATKQEVILCSDSSCKHDSERCTSIVADAVIGCSELFFYKEHLYYLVTDFDYEGGFSAGMVPSEEGYPDDTLYTTTSQLFRMNPDGTNRELMYTFGDSEIVEHFAVGDGDCLWFITKEPTIERDEKTGAGYRGSKNRAAVRFDLNDRKIVEQIPISYKDNIDKQFIGIYKNKMLFGGIAYPDGKSAMDYIDILAPSPTVGDTTGMEEYLEFMSTCEYAFFALDITDKTMSEIFRTGFDKSVLGFEQIGDKLYIPAKDNTAFTLDLNTGSTEDFNIPEGYELDFFVGERPVYITADRGHKRSIADPATGEMKKWLFDSGSTNIIALNSDSALVVYKTVGEEVPGGGIKNPVDLYALISLDDLYNGRENFKPINMLERGK